MKTTNLNVNNKINHNFNLFKIKKNIIVEFREIYDKKYIK